MDEVDDVCCNVRVLCAETITKFFKKYKIKFTVRGDARSSYQAVARVSKSSRHGMRWQFAHSLRIVYESGTTIWS